MIQNNFFKTLFWKKLEASKGPWLCIKVTSYDSMFAITSHLSYFSNIMITQSYNKFWQWNIRPKHLLSFYSLRVMLMWNWMDYISLFSNSNPWNTLFPSYWVILRKEYLEWNNSWDVSLTETSKYQIQDSLEHWGLELKPTTRIIGQLRLFHVWKY